MRNLLISFAVALVLGCGAGTPLRVEVSGAVRVNGAPLAQGFISFDPADGRGSAASGEIRDGVFQLPCEIGAKRVAIRASRPSPLPGPDGGPDFEQFLPDRYNTATTLTVDVVARGPNRFEFDLTAPEGGSRGVPRPLSPKIQVGKAP